MKARLDITVIIAILILSHSEVFASEKNGIWIADWSNLSEVRVVITQVALEGVVVSGEGFSIKIQTQTVSSSELKKVVGIKYFGLNRRSDDAFNSQMTSMELVYSGQKMTVPSIALVDILNPLIGERMNVIFSDDKNQIKAITIDGPDGAEGYMVAFIFENNQFARRQIRSNSPTPNGWPLLQDKEY